VNILRDIPADLKQGRCYIPAERLDQEGLSPFHLKDPANEPRFRPLYHELLNRAQAHLMAGWEYTNRVPWNRVRVRLACAWPVLIGLQTLKLLRSANVLDANRRIKVDRAGVRSAILRSVALYPMPSAWRRLPETV
jgi:farnesyl-diphosphate farnesyltransferase